MCLHLSSNYLFGRGEREMGRERVFLLERVFFFSSSFLKEKKIKNFVINLHLSFFFFETESH